MCSLYLHPERRGVGNSPRCEILGLLEKIRLCAADFPAQQTRGRKMNSADNVVIGAAVCAPISSHHLTCVCHALLGGFESSELCGFHNREVAAVKDTHAALLICSIIIVPRFYSFRFMHPRL